MSNLSTGFLSQIFTLPKGPLTKSFTLLKLRSNGILSIRTPIPDVYPAKGEGKSFLSSLSKWTAKYYSIMLFSKASPGLGDNHGAISSSLYPSKGEVSKKESQLSNLYTGLLSQSFTLPRGANPDAVSFSLSKVRCQSGFSYQIKAKDSFTQSFTLPMNGDQS